VEARGVFNASRREQEEECTMADQGEDVKGDRGGDTGNTKQQGKGPQAEKGDERREKMGDQGPTHSGGNPRGRSGSESNAS
jgi:hypothetical protein